MSDTNYSAIDRTNDETHLDDLVVGLVNGEMTHARWTDEAIPLLTRNPDYDLMGMIDAALEGGNAWDALEAEPISIDITEIAKALGEPIHV